MAWFDNYVAVHFKTNPARPIGGTHKRVDGSDLFLPVAWKVNARARELIITHIPVAWESIFTPIEYRTIMEESNQCSQKLLARRQNAEPCLELVPS